MKILENLWQSSETFGNLRKQFKSVFHRFMIFKIFGNLRKFLENFGNGSKVIFTCFHDFLKFLENLRKSSEVFGNLRKFSENFGNGSKVIFRCFYGFLIFLKMPPGYMFPDISPSVYTPGSRLFKKPEMATLGSSFRAQTLPHG